MPKIQIDGVGTVSVDDSFSKLSPANQNATVDEITASVRGSSGSPKTNTYDVRGPDGSIYTFTAPEGASESEILAYAQANAGSLKPASTKPDLGRIRSNISTLIDKGAPESDIDQYLAEEGVTAAQMRAYGQSLPAQPHANIQSELQRRFDSGATAQDLRNYAQQNGNYDLKGLDEAISFRDKGGKGAIVAPPQDGLPRTPENQWTPDDPKDIANREKAAADNLSASKPSAPHPQDGPGLVRRIASAVPEGIVDSLTAPLSLMTGEDVGGALSKGMHDGLGIGQLDESYAPRSALERYTQAAARGVGSVVAPELAGEALLAKLAPKAGAALVEKATTRAPSLLEKATSVAGDKASKLAKVVKDYPVSTKAVAAASGAGGGVGAEAAGDLTDGNPYAKFAGSMIGGMAGGLSGAKASNVARKRLTPNAYFADLHANNPHLGLDAAVSTDVERVVSSVPSHDASGRKISAMVRGAILRNRIDQLASGYLPNVETINALAIPPSQRRMLRNALDGALTLSPENIDALRATPHGAEVADAILKVQRLRHYIPEGSASAPERSLAGLVADTAGVAISSKVAGPAGAAAYRVGREALASKLPGGRGDAAVDIKALAGRASAFRKLADTQGITIPQSIGRPLEKAANEAQDGEYASRLARKALEAQNAKIGIKNDRDNVKPGGGFRGMIYDQVGILPAAQDQGALRMMKDGAMSPEQFDAFLKSPEKLQQGRGGLAIIDRLASMADEGHLDRDPSWSPPQPPSPALQMAVDGTGETLRNPLAYAATAKGNQNRVTAALNGVWNNADLDEPTKRTIGSAVSKLGTTSSRGEADDLLSSVIEGLPEAHRDYGRTILTPLVSAIKAR